ncbi:MAG: hypothetical protein D6830_01340 [Ignavibacteria bacterium]|nr:MAG: hypothetical protein D6830_01340 [Ignavibacteria bacterium]
MIPTAKAALVAGSRQIFYKQKFMLLLFVTNSILALIMTIPVSNMLYDNLNHSLMSDKLAMGFNFIWFTQFMEIYKRGISQLPLLLYGVAFIYVLINTFYAGGLISVFNSPQKDHIIDFFYGGVKYWFRFMKVVLVSVLLYVTAFIINSFFGDFIHYLFYGTENEIWDFSLRAFRYAFLIFMIGIVSIVSDYTKVIMAAENSHDLIGSIKKAAIFINQNFRKVFGVFFFVALLGGLGSVFYNIFDLVIPRTPYYFLILSFILQQILVIFRLNIRMLFYSTEVLLYKDLNAEVLEKVELVETEK